MSAGAPSPVPRLRHWPQRARASGVRAGQSAVFRCLHSTMDRFLAFPLPAALRSAAGLSKESRAPGAVRRRQQTNRATKPQRTAVRREIVSFFSFAISLVLSLGLCVRTVFLNSADTRGEMKTAEASRLAASRSPPRVVVEFCALERPVKSCTQKLANRGAWHALRGAFLCLFHFATSVRTTGRCLMR